MSEKIRKSIDSGVPREKLKIQNFELFDDNRLVKHNPNSEAEEKSEDYSI